MKINTVKFLFAIALALILGFVCEIIAPEVESRNWISFAVAAVSICAGFIPAFGLTYTNAKRGVSIKILSWILSIVLIASNIIFSCFEYKVDVYIAITLLIAVLGWIAIYGMFSAKSNE